ncbi:MAG: hypothetical protein DRP64_06900 [Verrucomicrobia bacterium]|nr:MAG: hypothetical protein DRP64_06900 [Verrucomicrobiota bacterium]
MKNQNFPIVAILLAFCIPPPLFTSAEQLSNPVAQCADCVMMKHRGTYYMTGTGAHGLMLTSQNLVEWEEPVSFFQTQLKWTDAKHTLDMHAPSLKYHNGTFYFYWNGIACATAGEILGPYTDASLTRRFDGEIDPFLFIDEDGRFYFYTVKFNRGNIIFGQEMKSPEKLKGSPVRLLDPRPESWETRDGHIVEGPEVVCYRDRYFMLYAANHTRTSRGQYLIGCAMADTPLGFNEESKYPYPVMEQSDERIADSAKTIIAWGANGGPEWSYATHPPEEDWIMPDFPESEYWPKGTGAFGWPVKENSRIHNVKTEWSSGNIWMLHEFELSSLPSENLQLKIRHLGGAEVYFNGAAVYSNPYRTGPRLAALSQEDINALHIGKNVIAVHCRGAGDECYIDVGLIDAGDQPEDDLIWNTGQPNLVRGPNGFEWFVTYFGMWNRGPHSQGINRTFFFDRELYVDGPTGSQPPQYQPRPYPATFSDPMDIPGQLSRKDWESSGGEWRVADGQAEVASQRGTAIALIRSEPAINYLFQTWLKPLENNRGDYGIVAWHVDGKNSVVIYLDGGSKKLVCAKYLNGKKEEKSYSLDEDFDFSAYHKIRFEKNGGLAELWVDDTRLTRDKPLAVPANTPGTPGLFARQTRAAFDAVVYTVGWDEYDNRIRGWNPLDGEEKQVAIGKTNGLVIDAGTNRVVCTKGDWTDRCEFSAQVSFLNMQDHQKAGIYPVYIDAENHLCVEIDPAAHRLVISGKRNGEDIPPLEKDLAGWKRLYLKTTRELYLKRPARVSGVKLQFNKKQPLDFALQYRNKTGGWNAVKNKVLDGTVIKFTPVETDGLRVKSLDDRIVRAHAWVESEPSVNIRTVKLRDKVVIIVNGKQELEIPGAWPKSQVGLSAENCAATFNGITCFQIR